MLWRIPRRSFWGISTLYLVLRKVIDLVQSLKDVFVLRSRFIPNHIARSRRANQFNLPTVRSDCEYDRTIAVRAQQSPDARSDLSIALTSLASIG